MSLPRITGVNWEEVRVELRTLDGLVVCRPVEQPLDLRDPPPGTIFRRVPIKWVPNLDVVRCDPIYRKPS